MKLKSPIILHFPQKRRHDLLQALAQRRPDQDLVLVMFVPKKDCFVLVCSLCGDARGCDVEGADVDPEDGFGACLLEMGVSVMEKRAEEESLQMTSDLIA